MGADEYKPLCKSSRISGKTKKENQKGGFWNWIKSWVIADVETLEEMKKIVKNHGF